MRTTDQRAGFMMLMLIAFTSIILGLATTFYLYCKRGMDDSQIAMRIANQRLAFAGALEYVQRRLTMPLQPPATPLTTFFYPSSGDLNAISLQNSTLSRTKRLGWFRVALADQAYMTSQMGGFLVSNPQRCVFVTTGIGPSQGTVATLSDKDWQYELRSWYLVELKDDGNLLRYVSLFPPPKTAANAILW